MSSPVEQIKQRLSVADVVGSYIKLQKAGANFKALCPFHSEKNPSFYVSPPREIWHCFSCDRGGDIFEFVKQIEGVEFPEALRILADRAGVTVIYQKPEYINEKTALLDLLKDAALFYQRNLAENKDVLKYLWGRGLKNEILKKFNVGFALSEEKGWRNLLAYLKDKGYSVNQVEKAGLVVKKEGTADYYDRFRGRIMFPLKDVSGRIIAFSGRVYGAEKEGVGKYINSPQTIFYDKSKVLYGFDVAKTEMRKLDKCVLVEGQMDVLMAYQAGSLNTVAVSGSALTGQHLALIRRLTNNLTMAFDGDEAGLKAAGRSISLSLENGFDVRAIALPPGKDPADMILENKDNWLKLVSSAAHIVEFCLGNLEEKYGLTEPRRFKMEVEKEVLPYLLSIQSEIDKNHWVSEIAKKTGVREEAVFSQLDKIAKEKRAPFKAGEENAPFAVKNQKRFDMLRERLLGIALWKGWGKDSAPFPEEIKPEVFKILENSAKELLDRFSLEAELCYQGVADLDKEIGLLSGEFRKENIKEQLQNLAGEVQKCEQRGDKKILQEKLAEFKRLSRQLTEFS